MNRQRRNRRGDWLSPDAYDALSPEEKRAIWLEQKREPRRRPDGTRRKHSGGGKPWVGWAMVGLLVVGAATWELSPARWFSSPVATASGTTEVRATFALCHTGGGTNCVVDGDTIWLEGQDIRIADIDAPETHDYRCPGEQALGVKATRRLHNLVNGGAVTLGSVDRDRDTYGRKLRLVYVDGRSVGETLVSEGLARHYGRGKRPWC